MPDIGVIYYIDGLSNLYRKNVDLATSVWGGLNAFQILHNRFANLNMVGFVLLLPEEQVSAFSDFAAETKTNIVVFDTSRIIEKPYALNQQHWAMEDGNGNDTWYGAAIASVLEKYDWKHVLFIPVRNLLIDPSEVEESLRLYFAERFEVCLVTERVPGAEWAIFSRDLILGLNRSNPEVMKIRGGLSWAVRKPLYPFKVGYYHCPRIRPSLNLDLRLNSQRSLKCYQNTSYKDFATPDFSYGDWLIGSGWEDAYLDYSPLQINIEPSSVCKASCINCPNKTLQRDKGFMSLETFHRAIEGIEDKNQRIIFSGNGEPLLNQHLGSMILEAFDFCSTLETSLQVLPDDDFPFKTLDHIRISVDAYDEKSFNRLRPGCSWKNIKTFIELASKQKATYESIFPEIGFDFLRRKDSEADILPFIKKWKSLCSAVFKDNFFRYPFDSAINASPSNTNIAWTQISGESCYCGKTTNTSSVDFEPFKRRPCRNALLNVTILSDGTVTLCPFDSEGTLFYLGNLSEGTMLELWRSDKARAWRKSHLALDFADNYCVHCKDWYR